MCHKITFKRVRDNLLNKKASRKNCMTVNKTYIIKSQLTIQKGPTLKLCKFLYYTVKEFNIKPHYLIQLK